ncbi:hypothetical protein GW915_09890 [bacterium]|nr:hypothetical protein [bacterium]
MENPVKTFLNYLRKRSSKAWKPEWKNELAQSLKKAQTGLPANFVAIIAIESDHYFELLFLLGLIGLSIGTLFTYLPFTQGYPDLVALPLFGFCIGCSLFHFRHYFLPHVASKAIRNRVQMKAKSLFYDHSQSTETPTLFLYFSEIEREATLLYSPSLSEKLSNLETELTFNKLSLNYNKKQPLVALKSAIEELGELLEAKLQKSSLELILRDQGDAPIYFISSKDRNSPFPIPVIKGKKDIN